MGAYACGGLEIDFFAYVLNECRLSVKLMLNRNSEKKNNYFSLNTLMSFEILLVVVS
jgi:choline kinase